MEEKIKKVRKVMTTTKKVKVVGKAEYTNNATGEIEVMDVISVEERDFNFHKLWLGHILNSIDLIGNKKMKLAFWIIDHLNKENQLIYTYEQIQKETKMSSKTIAETFKALEQSNFLKRKHSGCYMINPDVIYKGTRSGRMNVLIQYREAVLEDQIKAKEKADKADSETANTAVTDTKITGTMTGTMFTTETKVADADDEEEAVKTSEETTTKRKSKGSKGRTPKPKSDNWAEIKAKIIAKEITKIQALQELGISSNTLNKWLAE